jgi:hypothetical protein
MWMRWLRFSDRRLRKEVSEDGVHQSDSMAKRREKGTYQEGRAPASDFAEGYEQVV